VFDYDKEIEENEKKLRLLNEADHKIVITSDSYNDECLMYKIDIEIYTIENNKSYDYHNDSIIYKTI